jgi:YbbR domain-containing protein
MGEVKADPVEVTILGDQVRADAVNEILTKPIDITGKQGDFTQIVDLVLPEGITVVPSSVTIQVKITQNAVNGVPQ